MSTYQYWGFDPAGQSCKGLIDAFDLKDAREKLVSRGVLAERVVAAGDAAAGGCRLRLSLRIALYQELSTLLAAGLTLEKALNLLIESPEMGAARPRLAAVRNEIQDGRSLADALAAGSGAVGEFERAIVEVGERSADLETVLDQLAGYLESRHELTERVKTALIYPAVVVVVGLVTAYALSTFFMPRVLALINAQSLEWPLLTRVMVSVSAAVARWGPLAFIVAAVAAAWGAWRLRVDADARRRVDRTLFRVPLVGRGYRLLVNLRFSRTLALLLRSGTSVVDALPLAGRATGSPWVAQRVADEAATVRQGAAVADAVRNVAPLAAYLPGCIQAGEAGGSLAGILAKAGDRYQARWERFVQRAMILLQTSLVLALGLFVLLEFLAFLLPIMVANDALI